ncbi:MAG: leucine-rich repeat protein [Bacteroidaceae bacterium]|nr:leucine-rich repeat protein [Bacteroidaceae bacterium]
MKFKHIFSTLLGTCLSATSASAQQWVEPQYPFLSDYISLVTEVDSGRDYMIENVGAGQFLSAGNNWATQISLTADGLNDHHCEALILHLAYDNQVLQGHEIEGWTFRMNGTFNAWGTTNRLGHFVVGSGNNMLFRDSESGGFVDYNQQGRGILWSLDLWGDGTFSIQTSSEDPNFPDAANQYAGWDDSEGPIELLYADENSYEVSGNTAVRFDLTAETINDLSQIQWRFYEVNFSAYHQALELYPYQMSLYQLLETSRQYEVHTAVTDAAATALARATTAEELISAEQTLRRAIMASQLANASEESPVDVTSFLVNPAFEEGNTRGWAWDITDVSNIGFQSASYTNELSGTSIARFIEAWKSGSALGDGRLFQAIETPLPAGKYVLEADVIAVRQGQDSPVTGAYLFVEDRSNGAVSRTAVSTGDGMPEHFSVIFIKPNDNDAFTIGLETENTTANWLAGDNFRLFYYGRSDDSQELNQLRLAISEAEQVNTDVKTEASKRADFYAALNAAQGVEALESSTPNDCMLAMQNLQAAQAAFFESARLYVTLSEILADDSYLSKMIREAQANGNWAELAATLSAFKSNLQNGYDQETATQDEIVNASSRAYAQVEDFLCLGKHILPGDDLTILIQNADFSEGAGQNVPGWNIASGNITELSAAYHNVEAFHQPFNFTHVIPNLPAGNYVLKVQAFTRNDGGRSAFFYAGDDRKPLMGIEDEYSATALLSPYQDGTSNGNHPYDMPRTDGLGYQPNSMQGAEAYFNTTNPLTGKPFYVNTLSFKHNGGNLAIGISATTNQEWVLWDNFQLILQSEIVYVLDESRPLIASPDQFSSPFSQNDLGSKDGDGFEALLDTNKTTYWHSYWGGGTVEGGTHYFQVEMTEDVADELIAFRFSRRNAQNDHTILWQVRGTNVFDASKEDCELLCTIQTPFASSGETIDAMPPFSTKGYQFLRFYSEEQHPSTRGYFHLSEFQLYPVVEEGEWNTAFSNLLAVYNEYKSFDFSNIGSYPGQYDVDAVSAFASALAEAEYFINNPGSATTENMERARQDILTTYQAARDSRIPFALSIPDGYYRIRSAMKYVNDGIEVDKYMYSEEEEGTIYARWNSREDLSSDCPSLWKVTNLGNGRFDIVNMATNARFNEVERSVALTMSTESNAEMVITPVRYQMYSGKYDVNINVYPQDVNDYYCLHQGGHQSGEGVGGSIVGWNSTIDEEAGTVGPSEWVFDSVPDEEALAIIEGNQSDVVLELNKDYEQPKHEDRWQSFSEYSSEIFSALQIGSWEEASYAIVDPSTGERHPVPVHTNVWVNRNGNYMEYGQGYVMLLIDTDGSFLVQSSGNVAAGDEFNGQWAISKNGRTVLLSYRIVFIMQTIEENDMTYEVGIYNTLTFVGSQQNSAEITIPAQVNNMTVTGIGPWAFASATNAKAITIPSTVNQLADDAFNGCHALAIVWKSNTPLPESAFQNYGTDTRNLLLYVPSRDQAYPTGVHNVVVKNGDATGVAESIVLTDRAPFYCPENFRATDISYTRNFKMRTGLNGDVAGWETINLPFRVATITHATKGELKPFGAVVENTHPFWLYELGPNGFDRSSKSLFINANTPYIIAMPNHPEYQVEYNVSGDVTFAAKNVNVMSSQTGSLQDATDADNKTFHPNYDICEADATRYTINSDTQLGGDNSNGMTPGSCFVAGVREAYPFEAYIEVVSNNVKGAVITLFDKATGMDAVPLDSSMLARDGVNVYNLSGQLVRTSSSSANVREILRGLPAGVYVVNGQKVVH